MTTHRLKCWPSPFNAMIAGTKTFEYRVNDRNYQVGDVLILQEWNPTTSRYTGEALHKVVTYVLRGPDFGVPEGYCIMAVK